MSGMTRYNFFLNDEALARLKALAVVEGVTVSEVIRYSVDEHLKIYDPRPTGGTVH